MVPSVDYRMNSTELQTPEHKAQDDGECVCVCADVPGMYQIKQVTYFGKHVFTILVTGTVVG